MAFAVLAYDKQANTLSNIPAVPYAAGMNVQRGMEAAHDAMTPSQFGFTLKYFGKALGYFVVEIDGVAEDPTNDYFWILFVNHQMSQLGIDSELVFDGAPIEFRLQKFSVATHGTSVHAKRREVYRTAEGAQG